MAALQQNDRYMHVSKCIMIGRSAFKMQVRITSLFKSRLNLFYIMALTPVILILYSGYVKRGDIVTWVIPFYGFLLLFLKRDKMAAFAKSGRGSRVIGSVLVIASFFVYFAAVRFYAPVQFYGEANYTFHILGLFLVFFQLRALREAFSSLFLIVGSYALPFLTGGLESSLEPAIPFFAQMIDLILKTLRVPATLVSDRVFAITPLHSSVMYLGVGPWCLGIYGVSTFSILITVTLVEDSKSNLRTKLVWALGGAVGTFFVNIVRVSLIFVGIFFLGYENWPAIHAPIGYVLFITWVGCFLLVFSRRQGIKNALKRLFGRSTRAS